MRLALYLHSANQTPNASGESYPEWIRALMSQFQNLPPELRKEGKRLGRSRIREFGLDAAAGFLIHVPTRAFRQQVRFQKRREKARQWPPETPACPHCKVRGYDIPKRCFPSKEMAERVGTSLRDPFLVAYPCPEQPGLWFHLGHVGAGDNST